MFGRYRGFAKRDAQRVHFRVIADFHTRIKNNRIVFSVELPSRRLVEIA
jgi:hypothetical protein